MGSKVVVEDKGKLKIHNRRYDCKEIRQAKPCSCSSLASPQQGPTCKEKMIEIVCSCCLLCVCCPLAAAVCCISLPYKICQQGLRRAWQWACYGSSNRIYAVYSSFSDIDSESDVNSTKIKPVVAKQTRDRF
ncbi:hypothetical protein L6164_005361 [Bauhinia variegata]|uniref:Uncharacterized protein n=1 Tax=Bauhinia variegata TaxID=167791 RepID=A0ACB9PSY6_BAUVA|nr:hypothetical protein L6164_005361 [Bauhinia variegata]